MLRPAERRCGQATAEWLVLTLAVGGVLVAASLWQGATIPAQLARALQPTPRQTPDARVLSAAFRGEPTALSPLGAQSWLVEEVGAPAARVQLAATAHAHLVRIYPAWDDDQHIVGVPLRGRSPQTVIRAAGSPTVRIVTFAEEAAASTPPTTGERTAAAVASLAWSATSALAQRIARPLGLAVGVVRRLVGLATEPVGQPAGERAGDVLICQPATILHASPAHATPLPRERVWRVGVLRDGRLIQHGLAPHDPCRAPAVE